MYDRKKTIGKNVIGSSPEPTYPIFQYTQPATHNQSPATTYTLPITSYQLPVTSYQLPITNHQSQMNNIKYTMKNQIITLLLTLLLASNLSAQVTISGNAYLENQANHSGINIVFTKLSDSAVTTINPGTSGAYSATVDTGTYDIVFAKEKYDNVVYPGLSIKTGQTLDDTTLYLHRTLIHVPAFKTKIQEAIDYALDGDTVLVAGGTYVENINFKGKPILVASHILLDGDTSHISKTVIDGGNVSSVVTFNSREDTTSVLNGFRITNGKGNERRENELCGGGIYCYFSNPLLKNLDINNNWARKGGGIYIYNGGAELEYCKIVNNIAYGDLDEYASSHGGGIYIEKSNVFHNNLIIENNECRKGGFQYTDGCGGGLAIWSSTIDGTKLIVKNNKASIKGGGVIVYESGNLRNIIFIENEAENGGGVYSWGAEELPIENCLFYANKALTNSAIHTWNKEIKNNIFIKNIGSSLIKSGDNKITFNLFWMNNPNPISQNPGLLENVKINNNGDSCDIYGNLNMYPGFKDTTNFDFRLSENSPCIDAGDSITTKNFFDFEGNCRIADGNNDAKYYIDIGPFELNGNNINPLDFEDIHECNTYEFKIKDQYDNFKWNDNFPGLSRKIDTSGFYILKVWKGNCMSMDTLKVEIENVEANLGNDTIIKYDGVTHCLGLKPNINHEYYPYNYTVQWNDSVIGDNYYFCYGPTYLDTGIHQVSVKIISLLSECIAYDTIMITLTESLPVKENNTADIIIRPNPVIDYFYLENLPMEKIQIKIFDANGKFASSFLKKEGSSSIRIDFSNFQPGIYFIQIINKDEIFNTLVTKI